MFSANEIGENSYGVYRYLGRLFRWLDHDEEHLPRYMGCFACISFGGVGVYLLHLHCMELPETVSDLESEPEFHAGMSRVSESETRISVTVCSRQASRRHNFKSHEVASRSLRVESIPFAYPGEC